MKSILLVEDNPDDAELTVRAFRNSSLHQDIEVAPDGDAALASLFGAKALPSLVLLDLNLPGIDGFDVLRRIRAHKRTRNLPVVILTSSGEQTDLEHGYRLGANSYVRKPVSFRDFLSAAEHIGVYWLAVNEVPRH